MFCVHPEVRIVLNLQSPRLLYCISHPVLSSTSYHLIIHQYVGARNVQHNWSVRSISAVSRHISDRACAVRVTTRTVQSRPSGVHLLIPDKGAWRSGGEQLIDSSAPTSSHFASETIGQSVSQSVSQLAFWWINQSVSR